MLVFGQSFGAQLRTHAAQLRMQAREVRVASADIGSIVAEVQRFLDEVERDLAVRSVRRSRADWINETYITDDTEALAAEAQSDYNLVVQRYALAARRYDGAELPAEFRRKLTLLKLRLTTPPPDDTAKAAELTRVQVSLQSDYGKGTYCRNADLED